MIDCKGGMFAARLALGEAGGHKASAADGLRAKEAMTLVVELKCPVNAERRAAVSDAGNKKIFAAHVETVSCGPYGAAFQWRP